MVISKILAVLQEPFGFDKLISVHIDYSNRPESAEEAAFVYQWAERYSFL